MAEILDVHDVWQCLNPAALLTQCNIAGLLVFDENDEEVPQKQFEQIVFHWKNVSILKTRGLGHNGLLRDLSVQNAIVNYLGKSDIAC